MPFDPCRRWFTLCDLGSKGGRGIPLSLSPPLHIHNSASAPSSSASLFFFLPPPVSFLPLLFAACYSLPCALQHSIHNLRYQSSIIQPSGTLRQSYTGKARAKKKRYFAFTGFRVCGVWNVCWLHASSKVFLADLLPNLLYNLPPFLFGTRWYLEEWLETVAMAAQWGSPPPPQKKKNNNKKLKRSVVSLTHQGVH